MQAYSHGRDDPLCPACTMLAQKQGVLKEGVCENVVDSPLANSKFASIIRHRIIENFNVLRNGM